MENLKQAIKHLHARKNASYADSWKRRGERISILPNIARKVDRLQAFADYGRVLDSESVFDTAIDLYVYALKYRLFLAEQSGADITFLREGSPVPYSGHNDNFDDLVDHTTFGQDESPFEAQVASITELFERIWPAAEQGAPIVDRQSMAAQLCAAAEHLIGKFLQDDPHTSQTFVAQELAISNQG